MLNIPRSNVAHERPGVTPERLKKFHDDPTTYGPGLHCTYLDTDGRSTEELMESSWNQYFIFTLANECEAIALQSRDPNRFAKVDYLELARERIYRIMREVARAKPLPGETRRQALLRLMKRHQDLLWKARNTGSRHSVRMLEQNL